MSGAAKEPVPSEAAGTDHEEPLEIIVFQAEPRAVVRGRSARLTWRVAGARWVHVDRGIGAVDASGSRAVRPPATAEYTLTAVGAGGARVSERVAVHVVPLPRAPGLRLREPPGAPAVVVRRPPRLDASIRFPAPPPLPAVPPSLPAAPPAGPRLTVDLSVRWPGESALHHPSRPSPRAPPAPGGEGPHPAWFSRVGDAYARLARRLAFNANPGDHP